MYSEKTGWEGYIISIWVCVIFYDSLENDTRMTNAVNDSQILCRLKMSFSVLLTKPIKVSDIKYFDNNDIALVKLDRYL